MNTPKRRPYETTLLIEAAIEEIQEEYTGTKNRQELLTRVVPICERYKLNVDHVMMVIMGGVKTQRKGEKYAMSVFTPLN